MTGDATSEANATGASDARAHVAVDDNAPVNRRGWIVPAAVGAAFFALFWPILAVRFHFYLETPRYSHCLLLPVVSALWIYDRWDRIRVVPRAASGRGIALLAFAVALFLYGRFISMNLVQHVAMLAALIGVVWTLWGKALLSALAFPLGYLALTIPLKPWDERLTQPMQGIATSAAEACFKAFGWIVVRDGNVLQLPRLKLLVEDACSGAHSLLALVALAVAWVFFVERPTWMRIVFVLAAAPIAVLANAIRVIATGVLAYKFDPSYAKGMSHETTGMLVFAIGLVLMLGLDWCLKPDPPETSTTERGLPVNDGVRGA